MGTAICRAAGPTAALLAACSLALGCAGTAGPRWGAARIANGAVLRYPPGWRAARGDAGSATAELLDGQGRLIGYLNLTPRQGAERLADWSAFRLAHNRAEGNRDVTLEGASRGVRMGGGTAACVRDGYTTVSAARYLELACLVEGRGRVSVIVAAAPPRSWRSLEPLLRRAVAAMSA